MLKRRILVIEDDDRIRSLVCEMLVRSGYEATEAVNGVDALDALQTETVDAVITDLVMPQQGGVETIRQIRSMLPRIPIIAMSGWMSADFSPLDEAMAAGADRTLEKPFRPGDLAELLRELLPPAS